MNWESVIKKVYKNCAPPGVPAKRGFSIHMRNPLFVSANMIYPASPIFPVSSALATRYMAGSHVPPGAHCLSRDVKICSTVFFISWRYMIVPKGGDGSLSTEATASSGFSPAAISVTRIPHFPVTAEHCRFFSLPLSDTALQSAFNDLPSFFFFLPWDP